MKPSNRNCGILLAMAFVAAVNSSVFAEGCSQILIEFRIGETNCTRSGTAGFWNLKDSYGDLLIYRAQTNTDYETLSLQRPTQIIYSEIRNLTNVIIWPSNGPYTNCVLSGPASDTTLGYGTNSYATYLGTNDCALICTSGTYYYLIDSNCITQLIGIGCDEPDKHTEITTNNTYSQISETTTSCDAWHYDDGIDTNTMSQWRLSEEHTVTKVLSDPYTREDMVDFLKINASNSLSQATWGCSASGFFSLDDVGRCGVLRKGEFRLKCNGPKDVEEKIKVSLSYFVQYREENTAGVRTLVTNKVISVTVTNSGGVDTVTRSDFVLDPLDVPGVPNNAMVRVCSVYASVLEPTQGSCSGIGGFASEAVDLITGPFAAFGLGDCGGTDTTGFLFIQGDSPDTSLATPSKLSIFASLCRVETVGNPFEKILIRNEGMDAGIVVISTNGITDGYSLKFYSHFTTNSGVYEPVSATFVKEYTVSLVSTNPFKLQITGSTNIFMYDNGWWYLDADQGFWSQACRIDRDEQGSVLTNQSVTLAPGGAVVSYSMSTYTNVPALGARLLLSKIEGQGGDALSTEYTYKWNVPTNNINYGKLILKVDGYGRWEVYQYDATTGLKTKMITGYANSAPGEPESDRCRSFEYSYTPIYTSDDGSIEPTTPRLIYERLSENLVGMRGFALWSNNRLDVQYAYENRSNPGNVYAAGNLVTWTTELTFTNGTGTRIVSTDKTVYLNYRLTNATYVTNITYQGAPDNSSNPQSVTNGTATIVITMASDGTVQSRATYDIGSGDKLISQDTYAYHSISPRWYTVSHLDGTTEAYTNNTCCGTQIQRDRDGVITTYGYDSRKRLVSTTRLGITTSNVLDAAGNVLETWRFPSSGTPIRLSATTYDTAGRLVTSTDALGNTTTNTYGFVSDGRYVISTFYPDGSNRQEYRNREGTTERIIGSAAFPVRYEYGPYVRETKLDANGNDTAEVTTTYPDFFGRQGVYGNGGVQRRFYDSATGHLWKERDPDGVVKIYQYNSRGEIEATGMDLNSDDSLTSGVDRRTRTITDHVAKSGEGDVRRTRTFVWTDAGSELCVATNETALTSTKVWYGSFGRVWTTVTAYGQNSVRTVTQTAPDASYRLQEYQYGRLLSEARYAAVGQTKIDETTYGYDAHGRRNTSTSTATGALTTYLFDAADRMITNTLSASGVENQTSVLNYDAMGRVYHRQLPDNTHVTNEYFSSGLIKRTYGSRTYPVEYTYDAQGRMKTMKTWQDFEGSQGSATTTWTYDHHGFLTNKAYADNTCVAYSYTTSGRVKTRAWARGNPRTVATYSYGFDDAVGNNNHPELVGVSYSNDPANTPAVSYGYDKLGRLTSMAQGDTTVNRTYGDAGNVIVESFSGGPLNGITVSNYYDGQFRRQGLTLNPANPMLNHAFAYDAFSRLQRVSEGANSATYAYLTGASIADHIFFTNGTTRIMATTKVYDNLNRLKRTYTANGQGVVVDSFAYGLNNANQRTTLTNANDAYWVYQYDELGQVKSGKKYWNDGTPVTGQQFEYQFDDIGNRQWTKSGGDSSGQNLRQANYSANSVNQYTSRTVPGTVDVLGTATNTATVTANLVASQRHGDYFRVEVPVTNSSAAVWQAIDVVGVLRGTSTNNPDIVTTNHGNVLLARNAEILYYDPDGNLTGDSVWTNIWNVENRLVATENTTAVSANNRKRETWTYLADGRWIERVVWSMAGSEYTPSLTNRFVWDGNVLLAILDHTNGLLAGFMRGLDLSGTPQGAGGVGGLLALKTATNGSFFYCQDGNGNVTTLLDADDASVAAVYEYDPFGKELRASGPIAMYNPLRFSGQYNDPIVGDTKYLFREYRPIIGKWLNRDPIGERGGRNLYGFVGNRPTSRIDPFGLKYGNNPPDSVTVPLPPGIPPTAFPPKNPPNSEESELNAWFSGFWDGLKGAVSSGKYLACQATCSLDKGLNAVFNPLPVDVNLGNKFLYDYESTTLEPDNDALEWGLDAGQTYAGVSESLAKTQYDKLGGDDAVKRAQELLDRKCSKLGARHKEKIQKELADALKEGNKAKKYLKAGNVLSVLEAAKGFWDCYYEHCEKCLNTCSE